VTCKSKREFRERLEKRHIDGKKYDSYNSIFHRWIKTIFRYVVLLHVVYIVTGGIFYISPRLRDIAGGKFLGKYTSGQFSPPTIVENTPLAWALPSAHMALGLRRVGDKW
jgi:hypothetical protein